MTSRLKARLAKVEAAVLPKHSPTHGLQIVWVDSDGTRTIGETYCWSRTRGSWTEPAPSAIEPNIAPPALFQQR
jgi:hypothetical protein